MQVSQQVSQRHRLPFAHRLVQGNVERLFILRVFDMHDHAVDLCRALADQHLVALMPADDISSDLIPDDRIDIAEVMQAAPDLFIGRIAGLEIFAGIVFCGLEAVNADPLQIHFSVHCKPLSVR